jgi:hypothetical protein
MRDGNPTNPELNELSRALIAFAMQKYYEERSGESGAGQELFGPIASGMLRGPAANDEAVNTRRVAA